MALLAVLGGCEGRPVRSGLPATPRAAPPPLPDDTPTNPAAAGGQRAEVSKPVPGG